MYELFWIARVMHKIVSIGLSALFVGSKLPSYVLGDQRKYPLLLFVGFRVKGISIPVSVEAKEVFLLLPGTGILWFVD